MHPSEVTSPSFCPQTLPLAALGAGRAGRAHKRDEGVKATSRNFVSGEALPAVLAVPAQVPSTRYRIAGEDESLTFH
jgi:hypothetical protein